ncbi:hypothetical protein LF845_06585 [Deferribacterales bacterium Es71-Z0220]|jgi:CRISPR type III-B/RAMP module-associated protein Cmr3|uniref:type III-B CRISPR module-associated Cmr3 family protein n=1 Tax=Deferrivibrio essentukiensis TaxID=2880922 RepID=UPI001F614446|nr:type III-B CRISPR module-associated Cmr3 family protein [Deferrivibrio essentukiensis]MCB4204624.1 hypothetical protein [Deferrivibrio essentukiensis]
MSRYLITFKPLVPYFFGSEQTFGEGDESNYFGKSLQIPQQTTILGALREQILIQANIWKKEGYTEKEKTEIEQLIGKSFRIKEENNFGVIKNISPVFFCKHKGKNFDFYNFTPFDHGVEIEFVEGRCSFGSPKIPKIKDHEKNYKKSQLVNINNSEKITLDNVITSYEKIGIEKQENQDDKQDKFYKKLSYILSDEFSFCVIADIDYKLKDNTLYMGADGSSFQMRIFDFDKDYIELFGNLISKYDNTVTLLSDAYVEPEILNYCSFAMTEVVNFRYIKTLTGSYKFKRNESKSGLANLVKRGSIFFTDNMEKVIEILDKNSSLKNIGFNIYKINKN